MASPVKVKVLLFIFHRVECTLLEDKPDDLYTGPLPFNLKLTMNRAGVHAALGTPRITYENGNDRFCLNGVLVGCSYTKETRRLINFDISLPDNEDRQQGLCP